MIKIGSHGCPPLISQPKMMLITQLFPNSIHAVTIAEIFSFLKEVLTNGVESNIKQILGQVAQLSQDILLKAIQFQTNCLSQQHKTTRYIINNLAEVKSFVNIIRGRAFPRRRAANLQGADSEVSSEYKAPLRRFKRRLAVNPTGVTGVPCAKYRWTDF
jgi:hypothetical protein